MATIAIVIAYTVITSYQFKAGGDILHLIFPDLQKTTGVYIIAGFVIVFTAAAGMASIAYLDVIIGGLVTVIVAIAVPMLLTKAGGFDGFSVAERGVIPLPDFAVALVGDDVRRS